MTDTEHAYPLTYSGTQVQLHEVQEKGGGPWHWESGLLGEGRGVAGGSREAGLALCPRFIARHT